MKLRNKLLSSVILLTLATLLISSLWDFNPYITFGVLAVISVFVPMPAKSAFGVVLETWANYIVERFWSDNSFLRNAYDDSRYAIGKGRVIHIPQPGSKPAVQKNRTEYPATAIRRSDTDVVYALDEYSTDPTHIPDIDAIDISYDMQDSVLGDHMTVLDETVADDILIKWAGNATVYETTGGPTAATVAPVTGQTGNRLAFHQNDLKALMSLFNTNKVPKEGRYILIDDYMYGYFYDNLSENQALAFGKYVDVENGVVGKLHSFNIMTRSSVLKATAANAVKALGAAMAATDNLASIAWQKNSVAFALGDKKLFQEKDSAVYLGDVHAAKVMAGGRVRRADGKGVYLVIQGTPEE